ncbi:restriction endonuclease subunit S [Providencia huaxiensis]|uniref:restriction endonuclease subunit S n=1 Tax=Providencia huaxiensis TaxID=2027290 RepID=UPI0034E4507E
MMKISEMPKYQTYKDSTEGWIGDVPEHWDIRKLKHLFYEKKHRPNMSLNCGAISFGKVVTKDDEKILLSTKASYQEVLSGEFLINPLNLNYDLISLRIALSEIDVVVSAGYIVIREKEELQKQYFKYLLHRYDVAYMKLLGSGVRQTISFNHIANSLLVFPPLEEQSLIAAFLDKKTALIDEAISIKEKQINLLKERKQIIIQQAVTQGLDPNVPMKDSGVDWIGKIPAHWVLKKIKHVTSKIGSGVTPTGGGSTYLDDGIPLLRSQNIHFDRIDLTDVARISNKTHEGMSNSKVKKGDVLLNITGGSIGRCYYVDSSDEMNVNQHVCIVRPNKIIKTVFLNAVLASEIGQGQIWYFQQGGGREGLNFQALKNFYIALPPEAQQVEIAEYIDELEKEFYSAIQIQLMQIEKLKEYKTTLINSAVTGKIKITPEMVEQ